MSRSRFITLEGGEGGGKSTQIKMLGEHLEAAGYSVTATREPGGAPGAELIRNLLVTGDVGRWTPRAEALLHFAAREDHLDRTIRPALEKDEWVICDRFVDSTRAYQGVAAGLGVEFIDHLKEMIVGEDMPGLTLILDLPVEVGLARAGKREGISTSAGAISEDRYERMGTGFHERIRQAFLDIARQEPERCVIIDATQDEDAVTAAIWKVVCEAYGISK